jgi:hypothetical protein
MPRVGFEPTIPVFEWEKTVYALDRAVTVIGHTDVFDSCSGYSVVKLFVCFHGDRL